MIDLRREGDVFILQIDAGENRFGAEALSAWNHALDQVEKTEGPKALVTTGTGKFYSNGLDLDFMTSEGVDPGGYVKSVLAIIGRVLEFPAYTVAAINGHAFGAGALIALAHDSRVMRSDRGYFCMPESDMRLPLHPGMTALLKARLPVQTAHEVIVTGTRYGAADAHAKQIVDHVAAEAFVVPKAVELARVLVAKAHPVLGRLKRDLHRPVIDALVADFAV
jgi:enoyl-CoA hydratase/carnithine racemase